MTQNQPHHDQGADRSAFAIAYLAVAASGAVMGFAFGILSGWLIWG